MEDRLAALESDIEYEHEAFINVVDSLLSQHYKLSQQHKDSQTAHPRSSQDLSSRSSVGESSRGRSVRDSKRLLVEHELELDPSSTSKYRDDSSSTMFRNGTLKDSDRDKVREWERERDRGYDLMSVHSALSTGNTSYQSTRPGSHNPSVASISMRKSTIHESHNSNSNINSGNNNSNSVLQNGRAVMNRAQYGFQHQPLPQSQITYIRPTRSSLLKAKHQQAMFRDLNGPRDRDQLGPRDSRGDNRGLSRDPWDRGDPNRRDRNRDRDRDRDREWGHEVELAEGGIMPMQRGQPYMGLTRVLGDHNYRVRDRVRDTERDREMDRVREREMEREREREREREGEYADADR